MRVLIVEDSKKLRESLQLGLDRSGFATDTASDGEQGLRLARAEPYDAMVLDLRLPKLDGLQVLKELRASKRELFVLILSAMDAVEDRIRGLDLGADDYLVKPFAFDELVARLQAGTRRRFGVQHNQVEVGDLKVDLGTKDVSRDGRSIDLTAREFLLLRLLVLRQGETVARIEIEDKLYGIDRFPQSNVVASTVSMLRAKLGAPSLIRTRRGLGYMIGESEE